LFHWSVLNAYYAYYVLRIFTMHHAYIVLRGSLGGHKKEKLKLYLVIPLPQILVVELQIHLCGIQVRMLEQLLHTP